MAATKRENRREETTERASPESLELPSEIIREILLRLPAKSIGRCRCVSKLFCSLSSDQGFAKRHLDLTIHRKLIVSAYNLYALELDRIGEGITDLVAVELNYPLKEFRRQSDEMILRILRESGVYCCRSVEIDEVLKLNPELYRYHMERVRIIGYSNGLVCMSPADNAFFLYNPTTGDSKRLPELPEEEVRQVHGFGFDDLTNDYKVVKLVYHGYGVLNASVYSLKADSWRPICDLYYNHFHGFYAGVNVNGAIHWLFIRPEANKRVIVAFDVKTDEFREMPLPCEAEDASHGDFIIVELNGRLCVVNSFFEEPDDIWVMNEYGVTSSWTRFRISLLVGCTRPLCLTMNSDEVLLERDNKIVLYNFKNDASRTLRILGAELFVEFETHTYKESLISPNSYCVEN